jgi:hypothetical protein
LTNRRVGAAAVSSALVLAGLGLVAVAPAASAGTVKTQVHCVLPVISGQPPADGPQDVTVDLTPTTVAAGGKVRAKVTLGDSPATSPFALNIWIQPTITFQLSGGSDKRVTATGPILNIQTQAGMPVPVPTYEGDFFVPSDASGQVSLGAVEMVTHTWLSADTSGAPMDTTCTVTAGQDQSVGTLTVEGGGTGQPTLTADPASAFSGDKVALSGSNFTPGGTPSVSLCTATSCTTSAFSANSLKIDGAGKLTGDATLATAGLTTGDYTVQVTDGPKTATTPLHVEHHVTTGNRKIAVSPNKGPVGTVVSVSGEDFNAHMTIRIDEVDANQVPLTVTKNVKANAAGRLLPTAYTITNANTAFIRVRESTVPVYAPFTVGTADPQVTQTASGEVIAGKLSMSQAGTAIDFGSVTINGTEQKMNGKLNQVTVGDYRGGKLGWSLTATMSDMASGTSVIPAGNISWTPVCTPEAGSLGTVKAGSPGAFGGAGISLCSTEPVATGTGGTFQANADMVLTTPKFPAPGAYTGTLTLSLS